MPLLLLLLLLFIVGGWVFPAWTWGTIPVVLGALMFIGDLLGLVGSFRQSGATAGLSSVIFAFVGIVVIVIGLGMAGRGDVADACLGWLRDVDQTTLVVGGLIVGFVLAAIANRKP